MATDAGRRGRRLHAADDRAHPDAAPIHDRQMVVPDWADWLAWLDLGRTEPKLLRPLPAGSLTVEQVR